MTQHDDDSGHRDVEVERVVFECLEADDPEPILAACRREHPELVPAVLAALDALRQRGLLDARDASDAGAGADGIPERLGGFRLVRRLGMGGMGVVYLAEQEDLGRRVALKLIRPEHLYFPASRERFRREVEAVARLQHAGIVQIHTVGEEGGLPFFSMELVDGPSLAELLHGFVGRTPAGIDGAELERVLRGAGEQDGADTSTGQGRRLFGQSWSRTAVDLAIEVGEALQHAHERGVLHRDVKPSNVLVTRDGRARLVDFGLARIETEQRMTASTSRIGSLPYLPPEQVDGAVPIPSPVQDVYSLGVTLYEMLTLRSPFYRETAGATRAAILAGRPEPLRAHNPSVSVDLATVCMTAMAVEPAARYRTMAEFVRDLDNVQQRRPIAARRPTPWMRGRRWLQRHPTVGATILAAGAVVVIASVALVLFERSARRQADRLTAAAEQRATEADEVTSFLVDLFRYASPDRSFGEDMPVGLVLRQGAERIQHELRGQPAVLARLHATFANVYGWLGESEKSATFRDEAIRLRRVLAGDDDPELLRLLVAAANTQRLLGGYQRAAELLDEVEVQLPNLPPPSRPELELQFANARGLLLHTVGDAAAAERVYRDALDLARRRPDEHVALARAMLAMGRFFYGEQRHAEATPLLLEALQLHREALGTEHPLSIGAMQSAASALAQLRRFDEAKPLVEQALELSLRVCGESHPQTIYTRQQVAVVHREAGDVARAVAEIEEVERVVRGYRGVSNNYFARVFNAAGVTYHEIGRFQDAADRLREAAAAAQEAFPGDHVLTASSWLSLANAESELGRHDDAIAHGEQGLAMLTRVDPGASTRARSVNTLALIYSRTARPEHLQRADELLDEAVALASEKPVQTWQLGRAHALRAYVANLANRSADAERAAKRAIALYSEVEPGDHPYKALATYAIAWAVTSQRGLEAAEPYFRDSIAIYERLGRDDPDKAYPLNHYGYELVRERAAEAVPLLEEAVAIRRRTLPPGARWRLISEINLANAFLQLRQFERAEPLLLAVHDALQATRPPDSAEVQAGRQRLHTLYRRWGKADEAKRYAPRK